VWKHFHCQCGEHTTATDGIADVVAAGVPQGRPVVRVKETSPNMVILEATPPLRNGGKKVIGYRVEFGRKMTDYGVGLSLCS